MWVGYVLMRVCCVVLRVLRAVQLQIQCTCVRALEEEYIGKIFDVLSAGTHTTVIFLIPACSSMQRYLDKGYYIIINV